MKFAVLVLMACLPAAAIARQAAQQEAHSHALGSVDFKNSGNDAAQPAFQRFRQGLETGKWDAYPGGFPTVDAAMKQPRPTPRALSIATSAAYESAIVSLRGQNDTSPARKVIATFRAEGASLPADAPRRAVLHRLSAQLDAMVAQYEGHTDRAITLLRELVAIEPNNTSLPPSTIPSYELLGDYLLAAGRKGEAADAYQKALELRPNRSLAKRGLEAARK
jgi:tetratricopeptide (TPR) repeat protein